MINWHQIDTILLDMDGTLLDLHYDNYFWLSHLPARYAEIHGIAPDDAKTQLHQRFAQEYGSLNWYCTDYWAQELDVDIVTLKHEVADKIAIKPYVLDFLNGLKTNGKRVALVTNAHQDSYSVKMQKYDLTPFFDFVAKSHDYGEPKEAQPFWHAFIADFPFDPARTLFIDDNENVLNAAETFGIQHLLRPSQPDSQRAANRSERHPQFDCYSEILLQAV